MTALIFQTNLFGDVGVHAIVGLPFFLTRIDVEASPSAKVVAVILTLDPNTTCIRLQFIFCVQTET